MDDAEDIGVSVKVHFISSNINFLASIFREENGLTDLDLEGDLGSVSR